MRIDFQRCNLEELCEWDVIRGRGFLIKEPPFADIDKSIRNMDGPRSPRYGTTYGDSNEFMEKSRCACGRTIGAAFEGETCPHCGGKVENRDTDILYTGWINLGPKYKVINPLMYKRLQSALSSKVLENIISNENLITSNGIIRKKGDDIEVKKSMLVYHNIGLYEFYLNYEEIMMYYMGKRKAKADLIEQLIADKNKVWTSKIPVYSTVLRPMGISQESYYFNPMDRQIYPLTSISINLKNATPIEVPLYLYQAQVRCNELWGLNFTLIDGKHGWIRGQNLGGEFNYSGRCVIILDPSLKIDEVDMPYEAFMVQYGGEIKKRICADRGWTVTKTTNYLASKFTFDPYIYSIMCDIVNDGVRIILNRNP